MFLEHRSWRELLKQILTPAVVPGPAASASLELFRNAESQINPGPAESNCILTDS